MSLPSPAPLPLSPETEPQPNPVPRSSVLPSKPSGALTAGLCVVACLVTAALMWALANQGLEAQAAVPVQARFAVATAGELVKTLRVGGTLETLNYASIRAPKLRGPRDSGRSDLTLTMLAEAGSTVAAGSVVAEFELRWLEDHIEDRESVVVTAKSTLRKRESEVTILKETERQARVTSKAEYEKALLDLRTAEVRSEIEAEVLKNVSEEANATWGQLEDEGVIKERVHGADLRLEDLQVHDEILHLERHQRDLDRLLVRAPIQGMIVRETMFNKSGQFAQSKEGDQIYPGALFMRIVDVSQMVVSAAVNQVDAQSIRIGDEATVELDAYPGERFAGRVVSVGAVASSSSGGSSRYSRGSSGAFIKHIPMRILIDEKDQRILPDLSASVDVHASRRPHGIIVPREGLRTDGARDEHFVYIHQDGEYLRRPVRVQALSDTEVLIGSGLQPGEQILLSGLPTGFEAL